MTMQAVPLGFKPKSARGKYAPYWADDTTVNPVLVRYVERYADSDTFEVRFPDGHTEQVHCHQLGVFR